MSNQRNNNHSQELGGRWRIAFYEDCEPALTVEKGKKEAEVKEWD